MCGIVGILNFDSRPVSKALLKKMTDIQSHRGPDDDGIWIEKKIGIGHRRLAIIDLSNFAKQPMFSEDNNYIISYNGEVFNYKSIRNELIKLGYYFSSDSDTEVVLKSYQEWGEDCVHKFNGMFAFAIWSRHNQTLFLARDRYGIIPLYYYKSDGCFIFSSEIKSIILHPDVDVNVSSGALNEYFSFQNIFTDLTLFENIKILKPGNRATIKWNSSNSRFKFEEYWDFDFIEDEKLSFEECEEHTSYLFEQAVKRQHLSDVEIGSYLSGGIDSGSITGISSKYINDLKTFTCGFDLSSASGLELVFDERRSAEFLSNLFKTEHYEVVLKAGDMERVIKDLVWHVEDLRIGQSYPNYYVSRLASKFVKVVLGGSGGDELFAGYPWRYFRAINNKGFDDYCDKYYKYWMRLIPDSLKPDFFQNDIYKKTLSHPTKEVFRNIMEKRNKSNSSQSDYINNSLYFECKTFLHGLLVVENKISMAHSLESRVPFLDNDLVDFSMKIPVAYKLRNMGKVSRLNENEFGAKTKKYFNQTGDGKIILRKALERYVPKEYTQAKKQGFSAPDASWFKGESIDYIKDLLLNKNANIYNYLQYGTVNTLLNEHFSGAINHRLLIWSLLNFEWWLRTFKS